MRGVLRKGDRQRTWIPAYAGMTADACEGASNADPTFGSAAFLDHKHKSLGYLLCERPGHHVGTGLPSILRMASWAVGPRRGTCSAC
jgi:hypothetical protein